MSVIKKPHDRIFRKAVSDVRVAKGLMLQHLPKDIKENMDFNSLKLCKESYIDEDLKMHAVDALFSVNMFGQEGYIYLLLEHQSRPEKLMPLRMVEYTIKIMGERARNKEQVPLVLPLVLYNGKQKYNYSTNIIDLINAPKEVIDKHLFKAFTLIDLNIIPDEKIREELWSGILQYFLKHSRDKDVLELIGVIATDLNRVFNENGESLVISMLKYTIELNDFDLKKLYEVANKHLSESLVEKVMTLGERLREEGRKQMQPVIEQAAQQAAKERAEEIAKNLLDKGSEAVLVSEITGMPISDVERLMTQKQ